MAPYRFRAVGEQAYVVGKTRERIDRANSSLSRNRRLEPWLYPVDEPATIVSHIGERVIVQWGEKPNDLSWSVIVTDLAGETCGECGGLAKPDDYLCRGCRDANGRGKLWV